MIFKVFFECVFVSIFGVFGDAPRVQNHRDETLILTKSTFTKNIRKNHPKGTILGSQNPPQIPPRSDQIAFKVEPKKKLNNPNSTPTPLNAPHPGNQAQKASYKSSIYLSIWLVLLDLPLVALIGKVSPSIWNISRTFFQMQWVLGSQ